MDLNELFFRHQIALMRVDDAEDCGERRRMGATADGLAVRIGDTLRAFGAPALQPVPAALGACA